MNANDEMQKRFEEGALAGVRSAIERDLPRPLVPQLPDSFTNPARWTRTRLLEYIRDFEVQLDHEHEVGARLVSFGQTVTFHISRVDYSEPNMISFNGVDDSGQHVQLIQNTSQLSVLLIALKKQSEQPRRIGFV